MISPKGNVVVPAQDQEAKGNADITIDPNVNKQNASLKSDKTEAFDNVYWFDNYQELKDAAQ